MIMRANILFVRATLGPGAMRFDWRNGYPSRWKQSLDARRRGRTAGPTPEGMIEGRASFVAEQPRNLRKRYARGPHVLKSEASPQVVDNVLEGCALASQSPRQRSRAHGEFLRNVAPLRSAVRQQLLRLVFYQSAYAPRRRFALLGRFITNGSKNVQQVQVFRNERHSET